MATLRSKRRLRRDPPKVEAQIGMASEGDSAEEMMLARLEAISQALAESRSEAVNARVASGIEQIWREDEEHYEGIDDKNRHLVGGNSAWHSKPPGRSMPKSSRTESVEFPNITRAYVDAAAARVGDIILATDDRPWTLKPTPVPDLLDMSMGRLPDHVQEGMEQVGVPPEQQQQIATIEEQEASKKIDKAERAARKVSDRIEDWMIEGQWHAEMRKVLHEACRLGSGVLRGPMPRTKKIMVWKDGKPNLIEETKPVSKKISVWNFYPDPACGESIHNGAYTWEVDFLTKSMLIALKDQKDEQGRPYYLHSQIDLCIDEGPKRVAGQRKTADGRDLGDAALYEIWYYFGHATREDLESAGCDCTNAKGHFAIPAMFVMVNDRVIKASINPLDSGEFPYDVLPWKQRQNLPWGTGVAREIRTAQRIVTAATRVMLTNGGRSAGPIIVRKRGAVVGADNNDDITPWKIFDAIESDTVDVNKIFRVFEIPDRQASLQNIINYGLKIAEDTTGLPMLLQGQTGSAPDTLGGQQLAERNANSVLRRIARQVDDCITEPHLRRYYAYFLQYGPDEEKGDYILDARGSTDLVEREIYKNEVNALLQASLNPAFGLDPKRAMKEHLRVTKKRPSDFQFSEKELKDQAEAAKQQQPDPRVEVAKIRAQADAQIAEADRKSEEKIAQMTLEERIMEFGEKRGMTLDQIKADLAALVMKLRTQKELSDSDRIHDARKHVDGVATNRKKVALSPPTEPAGRAPAGESFAK